MKVPAEGVGVFGAEGSLDSAIVNGIIECGEFRAVHDLILGLSVS